MSVPLQKLSIPTTTAGVAAIIQETRKATNRKTLSYAVHDFLGQSARKTVQHQRIEQVRNALPVKLKVQRWHLYDANGQVVGRLANRIARILQGKHNPTFNPSHASRKDVVVVVNCRYAKFTGNRERVKLYRHHTFYPGGLKEIPAFRMRERNPTKILEHAVAGMLPKTSLRPLLLKSYLKLYPGPQHPHAAQFPTRVDLELKSDDVKPTTFVSDEEIAMGKESMWRTTDNSMATPKKRMHVMRRELRKHAISSQIDWIFRMRKEREKQMQNSQTSPNPSPTPASASATAATTTPPSPSSPPKQY